MIEIRDDRRKEREAIRRINKQPFGQPATVYIADAPRAKCPGLFSFVTLIGGRVEAHFLFSTVVIKAGKGAVPKRGPAPMAVLP